MAALLLMQFVCLCLCLCQCSPAVDLGLDLDLKKVEVPEERECYGTYIGFGYSGTLEMHYKHLRRRYADCTHITGNLEITNLVDPKLEYDLSFLRTIRYVSGAVLIGLVTEVEEIPLVNLEVIRGNQTYSLQGDQYSLVVVLTARGTDETFGLKELQMPALKEITHGKVLLKKNSALGFVDTVDWTPVMRGREDDVHFMDKSFNETVSNVTDAVPCPLGPRWGKGADMCQSVTDSFYLECHPSCQGRCHGEGEDQCCHQDCAVGCTGGGQGDCLNCKDYKYDGRCVGFCPAKSYPKNQDCVKYNE